MYKQQSNEKGFTMIETLISLSIVSVLLFIVVPVQTNLIQKKEEEFFLEMLTYDLFHLQNSSYGNWTGIHLEPHDYGYRIDNSYQDFVARRLLPTGWEWDATLPRKFRFNENGTFINPRVLRIKTNDEVIRLVFPMGKGRFYVKE